MRASDYVITPVDVWHGIRNLGWVRGMLLVVASVGSVVALRRGFSAELVLLVFSIATALLLRIDSRLPFIAAIVLLVAIAALSAFDPGMSGTKDTPQERLAVLVYYCLVLGVSLLIEEQIVSDRVKQAVPAASPSPKMPVQLPGLPQVAAKTSLGRMVASAQQMHEPAQSTADIARRIGLHPMRHHVSAITVAATPPATRRVSMDGIRPAVIGAKHVAHGIRVLPTVPAQAASVPRPAVVPMRPSAAPQIRRATRRSIDGFVIRQSPAARIGSAVSHAVGA